LIFAARNENGESTCDLVLDGSKTVTRRLRPVEVGKIRAVQPGRGKHAQGYIRVLGCVNSMDHYWQFAPGMDLGVFKDQEAALEGFCSWRGLMQYLMDHNVSFDDTFRIEFEVI